MGARGEHLSLTPPDGPWLPSGLSFSALCPAVFAVVSSVQESVPLADTASGRTGVLCTVSPQLLCGPRDKRRVSPESPAVELEVVRWVTLSGRTRILTEGAQSLPGQVPYEGAPVVTLEASLQVGALLLRRVPGLGHTGFKHGCLAECMCRKLGH